MNKSIKTILVIIGVCLIGYGIYTMVVPETIMSIGSLEVKANDNNNSSFITIGLGLLALFIGLLGSRKT